MKKYTKDYYKNNGQSGDRPALQMYCRIFRRCVATGSKVLEFGAGNGFLSKKLAKYFQSSAIELSDFARRNIKTNSPNTEIIVNEDKLTNNTYDGIVSLHTLEHLENPRIELKKLVKSMKKGGMFLAVMPDLDALGHKIKKQEWFGYRDPTHVSLLGGKEWKQLFEECGLNIVKTGSDWFWDPPYLTWVPNLIQKLIFYPGCLLMVWVGRIIYPQGWGEDLIVVARKN